VTISATIREENGDICIALGAASRTAGILTRLIVGSGCYGLSGLYSSLIAFNPCWLKGPIEDELPLMPLGVSCSALIGDRMCPY